MCIRNSNTLIYISSPVYILAPVSSILFRVPHASSWALKNQTERYHLKFIITTILAGALAMAGSAYAHEGHDKGVSFETPKDGATVSQTFKVEMEVEGMKVHKAGDPVKGTGHFHIIVDGACVKQGDVVAKDATHIHFGKAQQRTELKLDLGKHSLTLQFADGHHQSYGQDWCKTIHVIVK